MVSIISDSAPRRKANGFTLVEVVIIVAIFVFASVVLTSLFFSHNNFYHILNAEVRGAERARLALARIIEVARQAETVEDSHDFSGTVHFSGNDSLVLKLKSVNAAGDFVLGAYDYFVYYPDAGSPNVLRERIQADGASVRVSTERILTADLSNFDITYDNADVTLARNMDISIVTNVPFRNSSTTTTLNSKIKLRNAL